VGGEMMGKGGRKVILMQKLYTHVCNVESTGVIMGDRIRKRANSWMIYLIHCKILCK
jgi:hypothetical protein